MVRWGHEVGAGAWCNTCSVIDLKWHDYKKVDFIFDSHSIPTLRRVASFGRVVVVKVTRNGRTKKVGLEGGLSGVNERKK